MMIDPRDIERRHQVLDAVEQRLLANQRKLQNTQRELEDARENIIELAPPKFNRLLKGQDRSIKTVDEFGRWEFDLKEAVIAAAESEPVEDRNNVACPLCRSRGNGAFGRTGFKLPSGLDMHLNGKGRTEKCRVIKAAVSALAHKKREMFEAKRPSRLAERQRPKD
jgi:hypothetical protein